MWKEELKELLLYGLIGAVMGAGCILLLIHYCYMRTA
jgi:hypothetical protein